MNPMDSAMMVFVCCWIRRSAGLRLHRKCALHETQARMCQQIRKDFLSGMGVLNLMEMHSWHFTSSTCGELLFQCATPKSTTRCHANLSKHAPGGTLQSPQRHCPDIPGLGQVAATSVLHALLEVDEAVFLVRDCLHDGALRPDSWPSPAQRTVRVL